MTRPEPTARVQSRLRFALGAIAALALGASVTANAQGLVQGVQQGAREGNKAAGPVGGVLGGAIGGVVGVVTGVTGVLTGGKNGQAPSGQPPAAKDAKQGETAKTAKTAKGAKGTKQPAVLTQDGAPQITAEQIVANSDGNIERIKKELNLTPD